jgi:hypothetical protein
MLAAVNEKGAAAHPTQHDVVSTDEELSLVKAYGQAAVTAATRLEEHHRATFANNVGDGVEGSRCGNHGRRFRCILHGFALDAQKKPSGLVL